MFAIPSHNGFKAALDSLIAQHRSELNDAVDTVRTPRPRDPVAATGPKRVGVLVDRGAVSASEVFVLYALRSARATVFGEPTAGALDYQSASIVSISPRERRWLLGYGTITRSADLPRGGMRGRGIPPQVRIDLAAVADPVGYVDRALAEPRSR